MRLRTEMAAKAQAFRRQYGYAPVLAVLRVGNDPASISYARQLDMAFTEAGMGYQLQVFPPDADQATVQARLMELEGDEMVNGVLLQRPLPPQIDGDKLMARFPQFKDVEGISPANVGRLLQNRGSFFPTSTPSAAIELLRAYEIPVTGKHAVVVGRSNILGRPMALLLLHQNATVTICHTRTVNLGDFTRRADLLLAAAGVPRLIRADMVKPGAIVVDFGVNFVGDKIVGDVDYEAVREVAGAITPVPGGTGPITTVMLMRNTFHAAQFQKEGVF